MQGLTIGAAIWWIVATVGVHSLSSSSPSAASCRRRYSLSYLQQWARENGVILGKGVCLEEAEHNDWGVSLLTDTSQQRNEKDQSHLQEDEPLVIMKIPRRLVWGAKDVYKEFDNITNIHALSSTTTTSEESKKKSPLDSSMQLLDDCGYSNHKAEFLLFVKLLRESYKGDSSLWYPWIQSLPTHFGTGVSMSEAELERLPSMSSALASYERLKCQAFVQAAKALAEDTTGILDNSREHVSSSSSSPPPPSSSPSFQSLCEWAYNVVYSRCWRFDSDGSNVKDSDDLPLCLSGTEIVPMGDMFNHREPANVMVVPSENNTVDFVYQPCKDERQNDHSQGESTGLYLSYGLTTNPHRFLIIFGFVDESMPEVFSELIFLNPSPQHRELGCDDRTRMVFRTCDGAISNAVWDCVLYALLQSAPGEQRALYEAHITGDASTKQALHAKYARMEYAVLRNHAKGKVRELKALSKQIEKIEIGAGENDNIPLIRRQNEFLRRVFSKVQTRLDDMIKRETEHLKTSR